MTRIKFVVSREHLDLVPELVRENRLTDVEIIVDRRRCERRQRSEPSHSCDRRHSERRARSNCRELELIGVAVLLTH